MGRYLWLAEDAQQQPLEGVSQAPNKGLLKLLMALDGIQIKASYRLWPWHMPSKVPTAKMRLLLLSQWQRLVAAQLPLLEVVRLSVPADARVALRWQLWCLQDGLQQGMPFSKALAQVKLLPEVDIALLAAAEEGGFLASMLAQLGQQEVARQGVIKQLRRSLLSPAITLLVGILVAVLLLLWLVPNMASMFAGQVQALPGLTSNLIALSQWLQQWGQYLGFSVGAMVLLLWLGRESPILRARMVSLLCYLPVLGELILMQQQWRLYQILGTGMRGGVSLLRCLQLFLPACPLRRFGRSIKGVQGSLLAGTGLAQALADAGLPEQQVVMLKVAQQTGQLSDTCLHIAEHIQQQMNERLQYVQSLIEPILTLLLTLLVGGLVLAIYLPLLQLGTMLR